MTQEVPVAMLVENLWTFSSSWQSLPPASLCWQLMELRCDWTTEPRKTMPSLSHFFFFLEKSWQVIHSDFPQETENGKQMHQTKTKVHSSILKSQWAFSSGTDTHTIQSLPFHILSAYRSYMIMLDNILRRTTLRGWHCTQTKHLLQLVSIVLCSLHRNY